MNLCGGAPFSHTSLSDPISTPASIVVVTLNTSISSTNWSDVRGADFSNESLGTSPGGQILLTPLRGVSAFFATFKMMYKEEFRKNVEFAKARQMVLFPLLLALVTMVSTIGLQFWSVILLRKLVKQMLTVLLGKSYDSGFICHC